MSNTSTSIQTATFHLSSTLLIITLAFSFSIATAQTAPLKQWDAGFGGSDGDGFCSLAQTADGGYILGGSSNSGISGDKTQASQGYSDYWIVKIDANGVKQWDARFGGSDYDYLQSLAQTADGGYILGGWSSSGISGDKTQASQGSYDYWIVKTDANGVKQWDARFGGSDFDKLYSLTQTADGGYILGGYSTSGISGDKTQGSRGAFDYWIVKTDANGVKQWDKRFGGSKDDILYSLAQTADGGYILGGESSSGINGDKTQASQGGSDYWIVKINANGVKQWDARFGGSDYDHFYSLAQTADGGYILGGYSYSGISGDKTQASQGLQDYWVVKTDANGVKQWDARFGGTDYDYFFSSAQTADGGYILGGYSYSGISGDKTQASQGYTDYWIVKTDANGVKQWDERFGGGGWDYLFSLAQTADGGYILGGYSESGISGDKTQASQGLSDYWIVKVASDCNPLVSETAGDSTDNNCNGIQDENYSLRFDGIDNYITVPNESTFDFTNAMTLEVWIKVTVFSKAYQAIVTKGDKSWRLQRYDTTNHLVFGTNGLSNTSLQGNINLNDDTWHHIAAVFDGLKKYLYVDGNLDASIATTGTINNSAYNVAIGENLEKTGRQFAGKMDEVRIWNVALTQAQIQAHMNNIICPNAAGLVAYFPLNEGISGGNNPLVTSADDITANNNNGTLIGFDLTGTASNWVAGVPAVSSSEICGNSIDDNCNGLVDEGCVTSIATGSISGSPFCPEAVVSVPFTSVGTFNTGNFYTAELSNNKGAFTAPTAIGTLNSTANSGTITAAIPSKPKAGNKYRIRVTSTNPIVTGTDNGGNLQLIACNKVTGLGASAIASTSATLSWTGVSCSVKYKVQYRKQGTITWTTKNSLTTSYHITGLLANTTYEYRIETFCSSNGSSNSGYTAIQTFTSTLRLGSGDVSVAETMSIYPNPAEDQATIQFVLSQSSHVCVKVFDVSGKEMMMLLNDEVQPGDHSLLLNTDHFAKGVYLVRMINDDGIENQKLMVQ